ncbi:hypothetical protein FXV77_05270 [Sphingobacterium phlebotomi]|uniref:Uncharacterized protein n=1 Tax=Sphingobacterium phlebotomi TaxID=2605433 RepID=A0A5D4HD02_9SPHI|nr:hypothetical protein [Sphingobacterium phlebotomi]TYR37415.1 hypothetical protein FXV77_05270 [Sphingobacterium phlebotomi]
MSRKLTTIDVKGTFFLVDALKERLCQRDDTQNKIPFHVFERDGDGYRILFDTVLKNIPESKEAVLAEPARYWWVILPALMELDPEGIALRYDIPLEILCPDQKDTIPKEIKAVIKPLEINSKQQDRKSKSQ